MIEMEGKSSRVRTDNPGRIRVEIKPDLPGLNSVSARPHSTRIDASQVYAAVQGSVYSTSTSASWQSKSFSSAWALRERL